MNSVDEEFMDLMERTFTEQEYSLFECLLRGEADADN